MSQVVMASVGASFALGFGAAWYLKPDPAADTVHVAAQQAPAGQGAPRSGFGDLWATPAAVPAPPAVLAAGASADELWAKALQPQGHDGSGFDAEDRLRKLALSDPVALRKLMQRYDSDKSPQARDLLKSILSSVQTPEVVAFSSRLAGSMNVAERKYGFDMLRSLAPDAPETRMLVKRALATEQSPEVLVQALTTLQSAAAEPEETEQMVAQLKTLSQHADPSVRSQSIAQLAQWDKSGQGAERIAQALSDSAQEVRLAAVFGIAISGTRSDSVKQALMNVVNNSAETKDVRGSALQVLEQRFALSKEEYAVIAQMKARMQGG
jgi:HEAT repeat protein